MSEEETHHVIQRAFLLLCLVFLAGCSGKPLEERLPGRWIDLKDDRFVEFGPRGLAAEVAPDAFHVDTYQWKPLGGNRVSMTRLTAPEAGTTVEWDLSFRDDDQELRIPLPGGRFRSLKRVEPGEIEVPALEGLWIYSARAENRREFFEFTPWGTLISQRYFPYVDWAEPGPEGFQPVGAWANVNLEPPTAFSLTGFMNDARLAPDWRLEFSFRGGDMVWSTKGFPDRVLQPIEADAIPAR